MGALAIQIAALLVLASVIYVLARRARQTEPRRIGDGRVGSVEDLQAAAKYLDPDER